MASTMRRAQETAQGINEVLGLEIETDPDLHELKQSDAFYGARGDFGDTASLNAGCRARRATSPSRAPSRSTRCWPA